MHESIEDSISKGPFAAAMLEKGDDLLLVRRFLPALVLVRHFKKRRGDWMMVAESASMPSIEQSLRRVLQDDSSLLAQALSDTWQPVPDYDEARGEEATDYEELLLPIERGPIIRKGMLDLQFILQLQDFVPKLMASYPNIVAWSCEWRPRNGKGALQLLRTQEGVWKVRAYFGRRDLADIADENLLVAISWVCVQSAQMMPLHHRLLTAFLPNRWPF